MEKRDDDDDDEEEEEEEEGEGRRTVGLCGRPLAINVSCGLRSRL